MKAFFIYLMSILTFWKIEKKYVRKSGGLNCYNLYKKKIEQYITFIETKSDFIQWVQLSKEISCVTDDNLIIGCVYIPPKQSTYSSEEAFNELEDEIIYISLFLITNLQRYRDDMYN